MPTIFAALALIVLAMLSVTLIWLAAAPEGVESECGLQVVKNEADETSPTTLVLETNA